MCRPVCGVSPEVHQVTTSNEPSLLRGSQGGEGAQQDPQTRPGAQVTHLWKSHPPSGCVTTYPNPAGRNSNHVRKPSKRGKFFQWFSEQARAHRGLPLVETFRSAYGQGFRPPCWAQGGRCPQRSSVRATGWWPQSLRHRNGEAVADPGRTRLLRPRPLPPELILTG